MKPVFVVIGNQYINLSQIQLVTVQSDPDKYPSALIVDIKFDRYDESITLINDNASMFLAYLNQYRMMERE